MDFFGQEISWQIFELKLVSPIPFFFFNEGAKRRQLRIHVPFFLIGTFVIIICH